MFYKEGRFVGFSKSKFIYNGNHNLYIHTYIYIYINIVCLTTPLTVFGRVSLNFESPIYDRGYYHGTLGYTMGGGGGGGGVVFSSHGFKNVSPNFENYYLGMKVAVKAT